MSNYLVVWKRGIAVLSAGNVKVTPDPRIKLVEGYNLEIQDVQTQDAGDYVCQLGTLQPREITHTLEILVDFNDRIPQTAANSEKLSCLISVEKEGSEQSNRQWGIV
ncbi:hypothetical protein RUM43_008575 [Polyplax serrata]|uniref:Ig-like domain-containing protein n=1 Tax=Polyplax serrata TaxID=468196 RepID=A0AAN8P9V7_POLSC